MKLYGSVLLMLLMMVGGSMAQTISVKASVPFDFVVNGSTLPAGVYTIQSFGVTDGRTLRVGNSDNHHGALVNAVNMEAKKTAPQTKLVFRRYGDRYFLAQVWIAGSDQGEVVPMGHRESELSKDYQNRFQEVDLVAAVR